MSIRLNAKAKALIAHYETSVEGPFLLPWLAKFTNLPHLTVQQNETRFMNLIGSKTGIINFYLKQVTKKAQIDFKITTHIARHTFATLADSRIADKRKISAALGHSKFSTTELYLSEVSPTEINEAMKALWASIDWLKQ